MSLNLTDLDERAVDAVRTFWTVRSATAERQAKSKRRDRGGRSAVTAGKHLDGFTGLLAELTAENGLPEADIQVRQAMTTLPGYFRPTKRWDLLVLSGGILVAAVELKSHVGPSFGNNFNNRAEEAIGTAADYQTAFREGAFGDQPPPFTGWLMLVEDCPRSRKPVKTDEPNFPVLPEFDGASYVDRYHLLCERLVREGLYTAAALLVSPRTAAADGGFTDTGRGTSFRTFATRFAAHVAEVAALGANE